MRLKISESVNSAITVWIAEDQPDAVFPELPPEATWGKRVLPHRRFDSNNPCRHLIGNFFCKLKGLKRIDTTACKTDDGCEAMIRIAAAIINPR
ncbi:hypothetical protein [Paracoccus alcaliphilus]|uniref:hypothetical protein n=1 Tax=Paracoccus alcaliphilus TaxID=34002 RepID=UPI00111400E8|nr:hypothetical protein [Paracoccus alcaliphilus]WCR17146.1 hypothetical protein JHW40_12260 [Paracoccus alcaliphilus]